MDRRRIYCYPTHVERYLAAAALWWAVSLLFPLTGYVVDGPEFKLGLIAPTWVFGAGFALLGAMHSFGIAVNSRTLRRWASLTHVTVWACVGFAMLMDPPAQLETGLYLLMAWLAITVYQRC